MRLEREGVVLGAETVIAKRLSDGSLASEDARIITLLSVAYGNPVDPSVVGAIRRASKHARGGDESMASMHIALAPLPRLPETFDAARRLFIADDLIDEGVSPRDIWTALDFDPAPLDALEKDFNQNEPRVPAGSGHPSGEWTREGAGSEAADAIDRVSINHEDDATAWIDIREPVLPSPGRSASRGERLAALSVIAGPAAMQRYSFGGTAVQFDLSNPRTNADPLVGRAIDLAGQIPGGRSAIVPELWREVAATLAKSDVWAAVEAVAQDLLRDRELTGCDVTEIAQHEMRTFHG